MKAITLWQPWATLIVIGMKSLETRSWATKYRGRLAIHASSRAAERVGGEAGMVIDAMLKGAGLWYDALPLGAVVGECDLVECRVITESPEWAPSRLAHEWYVGNFEPRRFAWMLTAIEPYRRPIAARGAQGLWDWEGRPESNPDQGALL
jgi:activating signal cointegrator 1